ncbi:ester cyclase [Anaerolineae bacterium CFX8]|nr:ester cyclase [Anaerolineae bacterium CFX8]
MSVEENKNIVRRFHELFDQGDIDGIEALLAPNCVAYMPGSPPLNREAFKQMAMLFATSFGDSHMILEDVVAEGDIVFSRGTWHATHAGDFNGIPATGNSIQMTEMTMARIVDGKIVEHWAQPDMLGLLQQIGVIPTPQAS